MGKPGAYRPLLVGPTETPVSKIEETFNEFTRRKDIAIILINQHVRKRWRSTCAGGRSGHPSRNSTVKHDLQFPWRQLKEAK